MLQRNLRTVCAIVILLRKSCDEILTNFDNGTWFSIFITDEDDIIYYDYRDELIDVIKNKLGFHIEDPDIKKGIQKTIYGW